MASNVRKRVNRAIREQLKAEKQAKLEKRFGSRKSVGDISEELLNRALSGDPEAIHRALGFKPPSGW